MNADSDCLFKSGWLKRKGGVFGMWQKCYCELKQTELYVRKSDKTQNIDRRIIITATTTVKLIDHKNEHYIMINSGGNDPLCLKSKNTDKLGQWFLALRSSTFHNSLLSIDSFNIISVIGRGFFGKVMLVEKKDTKELFALKTVHKMRLLQSKKVNTILAERNIMRRCEHPFIVSIKFAFQSATKFYLGLEYIAGGEIFSLMRRHAIFTQHQIQLFVAEIALALNHLHSIGIIYRDLKPENILVGTDGHLKLTDFGLSKDISVVQSTHTFCGTVDFMAPEVIEKKSYSFPVDWWGLGILTYEFFFGRSPFYDDNRNRMFSKISLSEPTFPPDTKPEISDFIKQLLHKNPQERGNFDKLKNHPFWDGINFDDVLAKKYTPEYIPPIRDPKQVEMFEDEFTQEQAIDSIATPVLGDNTVFKNFTFMGSLDEEEKDHKSKKEDKHYPMAKQDTLPK
ncbi:AGC family protein kinase [Tritrichomonas foetus]|uniref:AGC family protein kinase n=1 Tax=Tritrichomonas foetus TaxID=1144522 RepID=A0A1J4KCI9_9EUKA|nr:AGC family protein kinase [Tritrichomonas foetus]|eukprot:OHT07173.1 AGC family protein kinase [Tritrichomonas foetus]